MKIITYLALKEPFTIDLAGGLQETETMHKFGHLCPLSPGLCEDWNDQRITLYPDAQEASRHSVFTFFFLYFLLVIQPLLLLNTQ